MDITSIKIDGRRATEKELKALCEAIRALLSENGFECYVYVKNNSMIRISTVRLRKKLKYHAYYSQGYEEWPAKWDSVRAYFAETARPFRSRVLHWYHWAIVNDALNKLMDALKISCNIRSAAGWIRRGTKNVWRDEIALKYDPDLDPIPPRERRKARKVVLGAYKVKGVRKAVMAFKAALASSP